MYRIPWTALCGNLATFLDNQVGMRFEAVPSSIRINHKLWKFQFVFHSAWFKGVIVVSWLHPKNFYEHYVAINCPVCRRIRNEATTGLRNHPRIHHNITMIREVSTDNNFSSDLLITLNIQESNWNPLRTLGIIYKVTMKLPSSGKFSILRDRWS